jgi:hypothetical protein
LVALPIDVRSGMRLPERSREAIMEYFRLDESGHVAESPHRLIARGYSDQDYDRRPTFFGFPFGDFGRRDYDGMPQQRRQVERSGPLPFFLPFFGNNSQPEPDPRASGRRQAQPRQAPEAQGTRRRYAAPPEDRPRRGPEEFFFGRRNGGF